MADISKVILPSGSEYNFKDTVARQMATGGIHYRGKLAPGETTLKPDGQYVYDGSHYNPVLIDDPNQDEFVSYTAQYGDLVVGVTTSGGNITTKEFIWVDSVVDGEMCWALFGDLSTLGSLAYQNSASGTYTPAGTVSQPSFTGTQANLSLSYTPAGTVALKLDGTVASNYTPAGTIAWPTGSTNKPAFSGTSGSVSVSGTTTGSVGISVNASSGSGTAYTPEGTVSTPTITVTPSTTTVNPITAVGSLPSFTATVSGETLTLGFSAGTLPTKGSAVTVVNGISSATSTQPTFSGTQKKFAASFTGSSMTSTGNFTPAGSVSWPSGVPTFSGTQRAIAATFTGDSTKKATGNYTPAGTVSQPTFTGTQATISVD